MLHRDLSQYKEGVYSKVVIYKDRIEFRNVGSLYGENTIEKIKKPEMDVEVRNKTLVKLVETLGGVIENRHTGIRTMIDEMKDAKLPEPVFNNEREDFAVTFTIHFIKKDKKIAYIYLTHTVCRILTK